MGVTNPIYPFVTQVSVIEICGFPILLIGSPRICISL